MSVASPGHMTEIAAWHGDLSALQDRIGPRFARPKVRQRAGRYLERGEANLIPLTIPEVRRLLAAVRRD
jgi:hypothetical protein